MLSYLQCKCKFELIDSLKRYNQADEWNSFHVQVVEGLSESCRYGSRGTYCNSLTEEQCTTETIVSDCCAVCNDTIISQATTIAKVSIDMNAQNHSLM